MPLVTNQVQQILFEFIIGDQVRRLFEMPGEPINGPDVVVFGVMGEPAQVEFIQEFLA